MGIFDVFKGLKYKAESEYWEEQCSKTRKQRDELRSILAASEKHSAEVIATLTKDKAELRNQLEDVKEEVKRLTDDNAGLLLDKIDAVNKYESEIKGYKDRLERAVEGLTDNSRCAIAAYRNGQYVYDVECKDEIVRVYIDMDAKRYAEAVRAAAAEICEVSQASLKNARVKRLPLVAFEKSFICP